MSAIAAPPRELAKEGLVAWLVTTDHKKIGILYMLTSLAFFLIAGFLADVIHAFWVPAFLFKRDAVPGIVNVYDYTPLREGVYPGRCAEYCGTFHAHMSFTVRVVSPEAFARWARERGAPA